jgi:putative ABC transport system ATP-binding protein
MPPSFSAVPAATPPALQLAAITKSFSTAGGTTFQALRGVSLEIAAGEYVAVLGKSGSGKSTLLNLVAGLDHPTSGEICVAGTKLAGLSESALALWRGRTVGVVFQFFQLLPTLTIAENILLAMDLVGKIPSADRSPRAAQLLELVGLADQAAKLSGGQQQRAAIARALANDPSLIFADEPTGNLDSETAAAVTAVFQALAQQGKTLVVVTHDAAVARDAHRVVQLQDGLVIADRRNSPSPHEHAVA